MSGHGDIRESAPIDIEVDPAPRWLVGTPMPDGHNWVVVGETGAVTSVAVRDGDIRQVPIAIRSLPPGMPPVLRGGDGAPNLIEPPPSMAHQSVPLSIGNGSWLFVDRTGSIARWDGRAVSDRTAIEALPDARVIHAGPDRAVVLSGATKRYDHGVLGDSIEGGRVSMLSLEDGLTVAWHAHVDGAVIEGQAPIVADLTGNGQLAVIVTASDPVDGARLVAFDRAGDRLATGPGIGQGFRWRHQIAVARFAPDAQPELAVVRTPHIGGQAEFYRHEDDRLRIAATLEGYASHTIGSRNLDMAVAGDFDGDGRPELVVPRTDRRTLAGIHRIETGAAEAWTAAIGQELATNLAAVRRPNGSIALAGGRTDGILRIWP